MQFGTKIVLSLTMVVLFAASVSVILLAFLRSNESAVSEVSHSYEQTLAIKTILGVANDYSEQIAELFVLGTDASEVEVARNELTNAIEESRREIREEISDLRSRRESPVVVAEIADEQTELERLDELSQFIERIEVERKRMVAVLAANRLEDAQAIYRDRIEHRFDALLDSRLDIIVARERREVTEALAAMDALAGRMRTVSYMLVLVMLLASIALAVFLRRSVLRPVIALTQGTQAVGEGDLSHEVQIQRKDEFGLLADRFNAMTSKVRHQREALQSAKENLEAQVLERTVELHEAATRHRELADSRARVLADLSHELRTPLTVVRGKAELSLRDPDVSAPKMRAALERIMAKAEQMSRLVDDMLFVARSEAGALPVERKPIVMQDVLADVLLDSRELSRRKDIAILPRQPTDAMVVLADADRLRQAVLIVLDNAVRIAPAGSTVRVTLSAISDRAVIVVSDEGPGFAPEEAERAFSRFWRGAGGSSGMGRGSGLGLSIAHWIMEHHEGAIALENHRDAGATVRLDLPLHLSQGALTGAVA